MASSNLPVQLTSFIGREHDLAEIERLLTSSHLVTLIGAGGSGKTRLAIQIADSTSQRFADGTWLVELAPLREPELVPQAVVQAFGLHLAPDQPVLEALLNFVRSKQMLLVLDNCEHLREACAQLARQLLSRASELRILATSREPLGIAGERIYPVSGLVWPVLGDKNVPDGHQIDPQDFLQYDAIHLFVERAGVISPNFTLTSDNAMAIAEISQRLDGMPLAIELASARANVLTIPEIAARLDDRFALLTSGQRAGLIPRHQTLRAAIDWSYSLLDGEEQTMLRRLAVFPAGCTLDTAEAVCSGEGIAKERTLDLLSSLVNKSLLIAETTGRAQARFRLLETIREYALEKLDEAGEARRLRDLHLDLFLRRAEEVGPKLGDAYQQLWLNWLEGEHDNLRAALAWALESGQIEAGLRIANALIRFWEIRGYVPEGMTWFDRLLAQADEKVPVVVRANALSLASHMAMFLARSEIATSYASEAVALAETAGDRDNPMLIMALGGLTSSAEAAGDYQTAFEIGERTLRLLRTTSVDPFLLGMIHLGTGNVAVEAGHYDKARELLGESLRMAQEAGDAFRIAHTFTTLGNLARYEGNYTEAVNSYEKSVALLRELEARHDLAAILRNLGRACLLQGDVNRAQALFFESMAAHQAEQNTLGMAECLIGLGSTAVVRGMPATGVRLIAAGAAIRGQRAGFTWPAKPMEVEPYLELARAWLSEADFQAGQEAGRAMALDQAIRYAHKFPLKREASIARNEKKDDLTEREREVAALIAQGKSNREIAELLVLSTRTIEKHVENILSKLGLTSRTQIVRWAMEHNPTQIPE